MNLLMLFRSLENFIILKIYTKFIYNLISLKCVYFNNLKIMNIILKDFLFLIKKTFFNEKKLLKKRIIRSIKNNYEKEISVLPKLIEPNTDTIDVGVYRGVYSYELARLSNHLHAFEANPILYKYLKNNLTQIIKNITLYNFALSNKNGAELLRVPIRRKTFFQSQFEEKYHIGLGTIHENNIFDDFDEIIEYNLEPNIYSFRILDRFLSKSKSNPFHLKFNTGLNRLGFKINDIDKLYETIGNSGYVKYIFSHLGASEDIREKTFTMNQIELFEEISKKMNDKFNKVFKKHLLNTSGILNYSDYQYDMVRTGIGIYGYGNDPFFNNKLKPILSIKSVISQIHSIKKNESVGYNRGFIADKDCKIGIIPIGHADGINRGLGNGKIGFMINDYVAKTIGNICMDMLMVDITNIDCKEGDIVSIIDEKNQTAEEIGNISDTISYEVLTTLSSRMKRIVIEN